MRPQHRQVIPTHRADNLPGGAQRLSCALGEQVEAPVSVPVVREFLGHAKLDTTQGYVLVERDALREAFEGAELHGRAGSPAECGRSGELHALTALANQSRRV